MPTLVRDQAAPDDTAAAAVPPAAPAATFAAPRPARRRASRGRLFSVASLAVAAAAVAAVLGINLVHDNNQISHLQHASAASAAAALRDARPQGRRMSRAPSHVRAGPVRGAPERPGLPGASPTCRRSRRRRPISSGASSTGRPSRSGCSGRLPTRAGFTFAGSPTPSKLGITVEPAGGSVVPTGSMLAAGTV